jgi:hypothetical protein
LIQVLLALCAIGLGVWVGLPYLDTAAHRAQTLDDVKRTVTPEPPPAVKKITVYQSVGPKGEPVFTDARNDKGQGKPVVVDNSKGNTFQSPHKPEAEGSDHLVHGHYGKGNDPIAKMQREQLKFQQNGHDLRQAQIERVIGE